jgi:tetratricopeptide (TPR) repeat protein
LNKALRTEDVELLYTFRSFIIDLCTAIENENQHLKDEGILKLDRGTQIPTEELEKLKENIGQIISTNGFLSTSRNRNVSIRFARSNHSNKNFLGVLFEIQVDPSIKSISFADIKHQSLIKSEEEILFNLNSLFKIHSIDFDKTLQLWKIQLNTTDEGREKVEQHLQLAKHEMEDYSPMIYFGRLLLNQLGQVDQARKYFEMLLKSLPSDHPPIAGSLNNIGLIYRRKGNYDLALDYYQQALKMKGNLSSDENLHKAAVIENIGLVHMDKDNFDKALNHLYSALEIYKRLLPDPHAYIAQCLGEIGLIYQKKRSSGCCY